MMPPRDLVFGLFESEDPFPIDFDDAWRWIGYARKEKAKAKLERNFECSIDFVRPDDKLASPNGEASYGGHNREVVYLTIDCFKSFCMMAGTQKGKDVRRYFLDCERSLRERIAADRERHQVRVLDAYVSRERLPWRKRFEDEFYRQIYRLKGWEYESNTAKRTPLLGKITNDIVYMRLQPGVLQELQRQNPIQSSGRRRYRHHQFLTDNIGNPHLRSHLSKLIMFMSRCNTWNGFIVLLDRFMPRAYSIQPDIFFELLESGHIDFDEWERLIS